MEKWNDRKVRKESGEIHIIVYFLNICIPAFLIMFSYISIMNRCLILLSLAYKTLQCMKYFKGLLMVNQIEIYYKLARQYKVLTNLEES
jgi:hypothetical protein